MSLNKKSSRVGSQIHNIYLQAVMTMLNVSVHVRPLFGPVATVGALKAGTLATFVFKVSPKSVLLFVDFAATLADVAQVARAQGGERGSRWQARLLLLLRGGSDR